MIRIFVGCASGDDLESQAVLEYTLRKHCPADIQITWMQLSRDPTSPFYSDGNGLGWQTQDWSTPFSGFRWLVPALCEYDGRAIYMDSDMIARADIRELWRQPFEPGKCVISKGGSHSWRFCVSLWDCERAKRHLFPATELRQRWSHQRMISRFQNASVGAVQAFEGNWNCIDLENLSIDDPAVKMIHYSNESTQPQLKYAIPRLADRGAPHWFDGKIRHHPRADLVLLFDKLLGEAIAAGYSPSKYEPADLFGRYRIKSHGGYISNQFTAA